jgi:hypothetical protein
VCARIRAGSRFKRFLCFVSSIFVYRYAAGMDLTSLPSSAIYCRNTSLYNTTNTNHVLQIFARDRNSITVKVSILSYIISAFYCALSLTCPSY